MTVQTAVTVETVETAVTVETSVTVETVETAVTCETDETVETGVTIKKTKVTWRFTNAVLLLIVLSLTSLKMLAIRVESGSDDPDNLVKLGYSLVATGQVGLIQNWVSPG